MSRSVVDPKTIDRIRTEDDQIDLTRTNEVQYFVGWFRMVNHEFPERNVRLSRPSRFRSLLTTFRRLAICSRQP
jgi:hypothetical protein